MIQKLKKHPFGFFEVIEKPGPQDLQKYYAEKYYQEAKGSYEAEYSNEELSYFRAKLEQRYFILQQHLLNSCNAVRSMLDVGCGEGYALAFFQQQGWSVKGFDFSSAGVESKNPSSSHALVTGDVFALLADEVKSGVTYDVVWLQNVLEHVIDPIALLHSLRRLITPAGIVVITVPNDFSITQLAALTHQHIDHEFWVATPDHLNYFDVSSLAKTVNATGWECLEMLSDFPVDWFLFHPSSNYIRDKNLGKNAHKARVQIENLLHQKQIEDVVQFWSAAAKLGVGRDITVFLRPMGGVHK